MVLLFVLYACKGQIELNYDLSLAPKDKTIKLKKPGKRGLKVTEKRNKLRKAKKKRNLVMEELLLAAISKPIISMVLSLVGKKVQYAKDNKDPLSTGAATGVGVGYKVGKMRWSSYLRHYYRLAGRYDALTLQRHESQSMLEKLGHIKEKLEGTYVNLEALVTEILDNIDGRKEKLAEVFQQLDLDEANLIAKKEALIEVEEGEHSEED